MSDHAQKEPTEKASKSVLHTPATAGPEARGISFGMEPLASAPALQSHAAAIALQRSAGNAIVNRLIQAKLTVGAANDPLEREADRVADQVVSRSAIQRDPEEDELQAKRVDASSNSGSAFRARRRKKTNFRPSA